MITSLAELFKQAIAEKPFHIKPENNIFRITETDTNCNGCQWVEILLTDPSSAFCFSIDHKDKNGFDSVFPFFNIDEKTNIAGLRSKNDAIIIYRSERKYFVLLIELKSNSKYKYLQQLKLAKLFVTFVIDRLQVTLNNTELTDHIEFRGILFHHKKRKDQGATRKKGQVYYENKNGFLVTELPCHEQYRIQYFLS